MPKFNGQILKWLTFLFYRKVHNKLKAVKRAKDPASVKQSVTQISEISHNDYIGAMELLFRRYND